MPNSTEKEISTAIKTNIPVIFKHMFWVLIEIFFSVPTTYILVEK